ncbi:DNA alkylation repair protein [Ruminococcaceae bacterium OttesenSCG-928-N02]|nr:DNA alkylation repair protein [Ruminococcaceae bacterium OttesenSCG-928-N02]
MPEPIKNMYTPEVLQEMGLAVQGVYPAFNTPAFLRTVMDETWPALELKARWRKITLGFGAHLPGAYPQAVLILEKALVGKPAAFFFPDFVQVYGLNDEHWDLSMQVIQRTTQHWSAEFAVRAFIIENQARMMAQMYAWAENGNEHVRRLASEGCRPLLPWGQVLVSLKQDPAPILPILEKLKGDPSPYVRKSVANNLNDISKNQPQLVLQLAKQWYGQNEDVNWVVKHGCRTLLKKGNADALALFGLGDAQAVDITGFALVNSTLRIGEELNFVFELHTKEAARVRLEYAIDYVKANGKTSRKIFQISQVNLAGATHKIYMRKHSFADVSVRKHYPGTHALTLIANGAARGTLFFELESE